jgi:hypothetical protein
MSGYVRISYARRWAIQRKLFLFNELKAGGEGGIRTLSAPLESVTYRNHVAGIAVDARVAVGHCPPLPADDPPSHHDQPPSGGSERGHRCAPCTDANEVHDIAPCGVHQPLAPRVGQAGRRCAPPAGRGRARLRAARSPPVRRCPRVPQNRSAGFAARARGSCGASARFRAGQNGHNVRTSAAADRESARAFLHRSAAPR